MTTELKDIFAALAALSPEAREEAAAFIRDLTRREGPRAMSPEERKRIWDELYGSTSGEEARELMRITDEAFETIDEETWR